MKRAKSMFIRMLIVSLLVGGVVFGPGIDVVSAQDLSLHTTYSEITVPPGETIRYSVNVNNHTNQNQLVRVQVVEAPDNWEWNLRSGGWDVQQINVQANDSWTLNFEVDVPLQIEPGVYRFVLSANNGAATLPITFNVSERGTFQSELTSSQPSLEGHADSNFTFSLDLRNRTANEQIYALRAGAPDRGWDLRFITDGQRVSSVQVEPNESKSITLDVIPPEHVTAGTYTIPVQVGNSDTSAEIELEVVITGTYDLELTTPTGVLSYDITAGNERSVDLIVRNTGTSELNDIEMSSVAPANWEVTFEPKQIRSLPAGETASVQATIKSDNKSLPGDYVTAITAKAPEASSQAQLRMTVETSVLWGWIGVLIIALVLAGLYYLFRVYGRR